MYFLPRRMHASRSSHEKAVRLSVKRVDCDKTEESSAKIFIWKII